MLEFAVEIGDLPTPSGTPTDADVQYLSRLHWLFETAGFQTLPPLTFDQAGLPPCFAHTLVGDTVWQSCWGVRHPHIGGDNMVPLKLLTVLRHVVSTLAKQFQAASEHEAMVQQALRSANEQQAARKHRGSPY